MPTGVELIAQERQRQIDVESWSPEHDAEHDGNQMALAAVCYAAPERVFVQQQHHNIGGHGPAVVFRDPWPWDLRWDKRHDWSKGTPHPRPRTGQDRIDELIKAGALMAAEIDRLQAGSIKAAAA